MARPTNHEMINVVHEILAEDSSLSYAAIAARVAERGFAQPHRQTVVGWVRQLWEWELIDDEHVPRVPPLMPAYLFLDLPAPAEGGVRRLLAKEDAGFAFEVLTGLTFNVLVRTRVRRTTSLEALRQACLGAGALDARAALVLRGRPRLSVA